MSLLNYETRSVIEGLNKYQSKFYFLSRRYVIVAVINRLRVITKLRKNHLTNKINAQNSHPKSKRHFLRIGVLKARLFQNFDGMLQFQFLSHLIENT